MGCAGGGFSGTTRSTLLITSTNSAKIPIFNFNLQSVTLVQNDGTQVPVLTTPQTVELGSINGAARPLVTTDIPQGEYASVNLTYGAATFAVIDHSGGAGSTDIGNYNYGSATPTTVSLSLPTGFTITGPARGLLLNLNIPSSTTFVPYFAGTTTIQPNGGQTTFKPVYTLTSFVPAATPTTLLDGKIEDFHGQVASSTANTLTITSDSDATFDLDTSAATTFAGTASAPPQVGSFVALDANLTADGSLLATLVQTEATGQSYNLVGPLIWTGQSYLQNSGREQQGPNLPNSTGFYSNNLQFNTSTQFNIAWPGGIAPTGLPFTPTLVAGAIVPGQNIADPINTPQYINGTIPITPAVTLEPQTIDATVSSVSTVSGQTVYQVTLAADDLISLFGSTQTVTVYATSNTHTITSTSLTGGSVGRFRGLLFNDGGTLRMVASEIEDGVVPTNE